MNVFEELVVELKQENLLEDTVIDDHLQNGTDTAHLDRTDEPNKPEEAPPTESREDNSDIDAVELSDVQEAASEPAPANVQEEPIKVKKGPQFFQKRAIAEVSCLQMVEHVLTGVEREYLRIVPKTYDDFTAKKALNAFLNVGENVESDEHKTAEFNLLHETEAWCSALAERDRDIPVASFRLCCENSRPSLSSQAMLGLARFYRNLPFSEPVRAKFDFIITKLFSRPLDGPKRTCLFSRDDALKHVNTLYGEWSSVPLYEAGDEESDLLLTALSFEDLATEAENASAFDQLITNDFFGRLRLFKESINEMFFAPNVVVAAIECNVRVGNAYVELLERERRKMDDESLHSKYAELQQEAVSDAAARTLDLVDLLRNPAVHLPVQEAAVTEPIAFEADETPRSEPVHAATEARRSPNGLVQKAVNQVRSINRTLLVICILLVAASVGIWLWSNYSEEAISNAGVSPITVEGTFLDEHLKTAKVSQDVFYGMLKPSWDALPKEKRQEYVQKIFASCKEFNCSQVNLLTKDGKAAAYASATRLDINMP
ncbi:MAG: hypothetical protein KBD94_01650 [Pyrinomonadaceae bacterium]|nr:hypothetical protein [Pyrinomonadaceae bacterium]